MDQIFIELQDGKLTRGRNSLVKLFSGLTGRFTITIEKTKRKRSDRQNRFFHGVIVEMFSDRLLELGWREAKSKVWTKEYIKKEVLMKDYYNELTGEVKSMPGKTSELSTSEFKELVADCQQYAAENLDLYIPDPEEQMSIFS